VIIIMTEPTSNDTEHLARTLDKEAATLDSRTTRALRLARDKALENVHDKSLNRGAGRWPLWMGSAVAAALVVVVGLQLRTPSPSPGASGAESMIADLEVLIQDDDLALIEDLEFLDWLSQVDEETT
jgi:hypothetical protein